MRANITKNTLSTANQPGMLFGLKSTYPHKPMQIFKEITQHISAQMHQQTLCLGRQSGGTILGFILGLLVGLVISLGVAVYVTKVPIPFLNKSVSRTAEQDAAEEKKNKDWDPNAPLYNKGGNKSSVAQGAGTGASAGAGGSGPGAGINSALDQRTDSASTQDKPTASATDLIGEFIRSKTESAQSANSTAIAQSDKTSSANNASPALTDPFSYYVQVGAFRSNDEAETQRAKLAMQGYDPRISDKDQGGKTVYRVRIGPLTSKEEAEKIQTKLATLKVEAAIVRVQR
jgi:cell division protein FtsN